ncbi:hypothetical protein CXG81DRAFT_24024 [Caulochytrium protostelioides]|uniref:PCI domain-containing protein n=1 Tax=Caulochytrium protostelioides TaxID=1555241 RepID=A0A4V1IVA4_9FUNG|nr:hypothetical protein CXG81DRAFT_24024 [Caulochytrium protostelioides]|eukprot:RKP03369.1 hypothetical protein CXG81DRAFT_24024 [Caulochytrium protostelioides]
MSPACEPLYHTEQINFLGTLLSRLRGEQDNAFGNQVAQLLEQQEYLTCLTRFAENSHLLLQLDNAQFVPHYNILAALILDIKPTEALQQAVALITGPLLKDDAAKRPQLKLNALTTLYNVLESDSPVRYDVFDAILQLATAAHQAAAVVPTLAAQPHADALNRLCAEWGVTDLARQQRLYQRTLALLAAAGPEHAALTHAYQLAYLALFDGADAAQRALREQSGLQAEVESIIADALRLEDAVYYEELYLLDIVQALGASNRHVALLKIFVDGTVADYDAFVAKDNGAAFVADAAKLDAAAAADKIRLLTLAGLASSIVASPGSADAAATATATATAVVVPSEAAPTLLTYAQIADALRIAVDDVDAWVIRATRANLVTAKMDPIRQTVCVSRALFRTFRGPQPWKALRDALTRWDGKLEEVLSVLDKAKVVAVETAQQSAQKGRRGPYKGGPRGGKRDDRE